MPWILGNKALQRTSGLRSDLSALRPFTVADRHGGGIVTLIPVFPSLPDLMVNGATGGGTVTSQPVI